MATKTTGGNQQLIDFLQSLSPLNDEIIGYLNQAAIEKKVGRGKLLLTAGEVCEHYYFIKKGLVRGFIIEDGKEITTWICREGEVITSIVNILDIQAMGENMKTLENSELIVMPTSGIQYLYDRYPDFNRVGRRLLERYYYDAQQRAIICRIPNAAKRYEHFINTRPELVNRVPGKYIASFLNMTEETLSRVRSARTKIRRKPVSGNQETA
ncbi:Crp/Fnr family transcriptional regulator [Pseudoflavitalea rhizosphaerae]|uniref:Crp/Fnr family transcriptional regulator n=1 Tax=Pseudoflavitalea rhizosphaerae TaxID=1884793 RepID=UPI000F8C441F|nr:Crp/Fnr family transcriptional regulator [Pseudoflavitalea rhizosphaerae]